MVRLDKKLGELSKLAGGSINYASECIQFRETETGYIVEAANGKSAAVTTGGDQIEKSSFNGTPILLRADQWKQAVNQRGAIVAEVKGTSTVITCGGTQVTLEHQDGRFPDIAKVIPEHEVKVKVNAKLLAELLLIASKFADANNYFGVTLSLNGDKPIRVSCGGFDGVVVPLI